MPPRGSRKLLVASLLLAILILFAPALASGQGCAQCRDNLRATPPSTQHAYRQAIVLLGGTAAVICSAAAFAMRHNSR